MTDSIYEIYKEINSNIKALYAFRDKVMNDNSKDRYGQYIDLLESAVQVFKGNIHTLTERVKELEGKLKSRNVEIDTLTQLVRELEDVNESLRKMWELGMSSVVAGYKQDIKNRKLNAEKLKAENARLQEALKRIPKCFNGIASCEAKEIATEALKGEEE